MNVTFKQPSTNAPQTPPDGRTTRRKPGASLSFIGFVSQRSPHRHLLLSLAFFVAAIFIAGLSALVVPGPAMAIVGGSEVKNTPGWNAHFFVFHDNGKVSSCSGALIAPEWVLTAGHCVATAKEVIAPNRVALYLGAQTRYGGERVPLRAVIIHPRWNNKRLANDLALLRLESARSETPLPISTIDWKNNQRANAYGWGSVRARKNVMSNTLRRLPYRLWGRQRIAGRTAPGAISPGTGLAAPVRKNTGICGGDSGGPLVVGGQMAGIVSWAPRRCVGKPRVDAFVRTYDYRNWILRQERQPPGPSRAAQLSGEPAIGATMLCAAGGLSNYIWALDGIQLKDQTSDQIAIKEDMVGKRLQCAGVQRGKNWTALTPFSAPATLVIPEMEPSTLAAPAAS